MTVHQIVLPLSMCYQAIVPIGLKTAKKSSLIEQPVYSDIIRRTVFKSIFTSGSLRQNETVAECNRISFDGTSRYDITRTIHENQGMLVIRQYDMISVICT